MSVIEAEAEVEVEVEVKTSAEWRHLSKDRLLKLRPIIFDEDYLSLFQSRPHGSFVELANWTRSQFSQYLSCNESVQVYLHNKIAVDGAFFSFCEQHEVEISCIIRDCVASWRSGQDYEKFIAQGVFLIKHPNFDFVQASLFHKGADNEDEVSFFVLVDDANFHEYIKFRNDYEEWCLQQEREAPEIYVAGGAPISYDHSLSWDDLFLPSELKHTIRSSIETWFTSESVYRNAKLPWKRGALLYGPPGCGKTTLIKTIISNYNFKPVTIDLSDHIDPELIYEAFEYAQEQNPGLLYIEDIDSILDDTLNMSYFLNLLDGISTKNGIFIIGTANDVSGLKPNIIDRPSRFDKKWEIPIPCSSLVDDYMRHWYGDCISDEVHDEVVKVAVRNGFSYAYLKELYLMSMFNVIAGNREMISDDDVKKSLEQLASEKDFASSDTHGLLQQKIGI